MSHAARVRKLLSGHTTRRRSASRLTLAACIATAVLAGAPAAGYAEGSSVVAWGNNQAWELGAGYRSNPGENSPVAAAVGLDNIVSIAASERFTLALLSDGTVRVWGGANTHGQFGDGQLGTKEIVNGHYATVSGLTEVKAIAAAGTHSLALSQDGTVTAWGSNEFGQLGNGILNPERENAKTKEIEHSMQGSGARTPRLVAWEDTEGPHRLENVTAIASGGGSNYALLNNGELMAWGRNDRGQLGIGVKGPEPCKTEIGEVKCSTKPRPVVLPEAVKTGEVHITALSAGEKDAYALLSNGTILAWGNNGKGGLGTTQVGSESDAPVAVENVTEAVSIAAGAEHALALLQDGEVVGWGTNGRGQLGNTPPEECAKVACNKTPKTVNGLTDVTAIAAGFGFSLALREGKVYSVGRNENGELGTGSTEEQTSQPAEVKGIGPVTAIDAGNVFGIALLQAGNVGPPPQITLSAGERSLAVGWTLSAPEFGARWFRYQECPEIETEEEIVSEEKCKSREMSSGSGGFVPITAEEESQSYAERRYTFTNLTKLQPYEITLRSFTGLGKTGEERKRFIWGIPLPARPVVTAISPSIGRTGGGTSVTLTGANFNEASPTVKFGTINATSFVVNSDTSITATSPAEPAGAVDVAVTTVGGTSAAHSTDEFTYAVAPPTVTAVSPSAGPTGGGTTVTITGANLSEASSVKFGGIEASGFVVNSETSITAVSPGGPAGSFHVTVTTPEGTSVPTGGDLFRYAAAPTITKLKPASGSAGGGTSVVITGTNLSEATSVKFGSVAAVSFTVSSATSITAVSPEESAGTVDVTVTTPGGTSAVVAADSYRFTPTVTELSPTSGSKVGGTTVTVRGQGFALGTTSTKFKFGATAAKSVNCSWTTECVVVAPAHEAGIVDVKAIVNTESSPKTELDEFTYF